MASETNGSSGPAIAGLVIIGPIAAIEYGESSGDRPALCTIKVEGHKFDGEPMWYRAWFNTGRAPELMKAVQGVSVGEWVAVGISVSVKDNRANFRAEWLKRQGASQPVPA